MCCSRDRRAPIKLLILHMAFTFGGAERTTANLLRYLDRRRVQHITLAAPEVLRRQLPPTYDEAVDTASYGLQAGFEDSHTLRADAAKTRALLRRVQPDVALGMMHYSSALVVLGARRAGRRLKTVASYRGPFYEYMRHYEPTVGRRLFLRSAIAATTWLADRVIVPSYGTRRELQRRFGGREARTVVIPNGIDREAVAQAAGEPLLAPVPWNDGRPVLCAAARLAAEKNLALLIEAFRRVCRVRPAALMILGEGPERAALEAAVAEGGLEEAVSFVGYQRNVYPYLRRADLFIHTCRFEGFGYAMLEAMACGTPVIATDCPYGPREIIGTDEYGILVPVNSPEALAAAILRLLEDDRARQTLAARGLERAGMLSIERMVRRYEDVLTGLVAGP